MEKPQPRRPAFHYIWKALPMTIVAAAAALVSGDCTSWTYEAVDRAVYGDGVAETAVAALISAGVASAVGFLFLLLAHSQGRMIIFTATSAAAYISIYATGEILPVYQGVYFYWLLCAMPVVILVVIVGNITQRESGWGKGIGAMAICGVAAIIGAIAIIAGFLVNYEICIGYFGVDCPDDRPINSIPFALIVGGAPPIIAACAAWLAGNWYRPLVDSS